MVTNIILDSFYWMWFSQLPSTIDWKGFLFFMVCFWLVIQIICTYIRGFISRFSVLCHWSVCLLFCRYHAALMIVILWYRLKTVSVMPPSLYSVFFVCLFVFSRLGCLWLFGFFCDSTEIWWVFDQIFDQIFEKFCHWNFDGGDIKSGDCFD